MTTTGTCLERITVHDGPMARPQAVGNTQGSLDVGQRSRNMNPINHLQAGSNQVGPVRISNTRTLPRAAAQRLLPLPQCPQR